VHIKKGIIDVIDGFDDSRAKGDVVNKVPVHDIEVNPVTATADGSLGLLHDSREIGSEK